MFTNIMRKSLIAPALLLGVGAGSLFAAPANLNTQPGAPAALITIITVAPDYPFGDEASSLLKQIQKDSVQISKESAELSVSSRTGLSSKTQGIYLNSLRDQINRTGQNLARLEQIKAGTAEWQQQAIDQMTPLARQIASNTEAAINHLNQNSQRLFAPNYTENLQAIADNASDLKDSVSGYLSVAAINEKADKLHEKATDLEIKADKLQMELAGSNS
jgi:predicted O-linked N-acetylglucosamine transferase (SPINDLY family)